MPSVSSRIDALIEMLGASTGELPSDEMIARRVCHALTCAVLSEITDHTLKLAEHFAPTDTTDLKAWLKEKFTPKPDGRDEQRWQAWKAAQHGVHSGSSLEDFVSTPSTTRITAQRPTERDVTSASFEQERADNIGKSDMNGSNPTVLRGPRGWKR